MENIQMSPELLARINQILYHPVAKPEPPKVEMPIDLMNRLNAIIKEQQ